MQKAVIFSLLLHACLLAALAIIENTSTDTVIKSEKAPFLEVTLISPIERHTPESQEDTEAIAETVTDVSTEAITEPIQSLQSDFSPEQPQTLLVESETPSVPLIESEIAISEINGFQESFPDQPADNPVSGISATDLSSSVSSYLSTLRSDLSRDWVEACMRYKNQHGVKDCPRGEGVSSTSEEQGITRAYFKTWVTGHANNARESQKLEREMEYLWPLMQQEGILGEIARQRRKLASDNFDYLNPKIKELTTEGGTIPVLEISGNKLVLFSGLLTLSTEGKLGFLDDTVKGPAIPYRPYQVGATNNSEEESVNDFKKMPPLFPSNL